MGWLHNWTQINFHIPEITVKERKNFFSLFVSPPFLSIFVILKPLSIHYYFQSNLNIFHGKFFLFVKKKKKFLHSLFTQCCIFNLYIYFFNYVIYVLHEFTSYFSYAIVVQMMNLLDCFIWLLICLIHRIEPICFAWIMFVRSKFLYRNLNELNYANISKILAEFGCNYFGTEDGI